MSIQKYIPQRNPHLLRMARKHGCMFYVAESCRGGETSTTVAAHENSSAAGKGGARKADDHRMVYACFWCHYAYDQGPESQDQKQAWFAAALKRQMILYRNIINSPTTLPKDKDAAQWAIDRLDGHDNDKR